MKGLMGVRIMIRIVFLLCLGVLAVEAGTWLRVALLGVAAAVLFDIVRMLRQGAAAQANLAPAKYVEPGGYRVVLQTRGTNPVMVIREIRRTTGAQLVAAKQMLDDAPTIVADGISQASADLVVERLKAAGARAIAAPMEAR